MPKPTVQNIFGTNATRTATTLTIQLADLTTTGATPATVSAEGLLLAINQKASESLTPAARSADADRTIAVERGNPAIAYRGQVPYYQEVYSVTAQSAVSTSAPDPDNY